MRSRAPEVIFICHVADFRAHRARFPSLQIINDRGRFGNPGCAAHRPAESTFKGPGPACGGHDRFRDSGRRCRSGSRARRRNARRLTGAQRLERGPALVGRIDLGAGLLEPRHRRAHVVLRTRVERAIVRDEQQRGAPPRCRFPRAGLPLDPGPTPPCVSVTAAFPATAAPAPIGERFGSAAPQSRSRCATMRAITSGSSMLAITRSGPWTRSQSSISIANIGLRRCTQLIATGRAVTSGALPFCAAFRPGHRPAGVIAARRRLCGARRRDGASAASVAAAPALRHAPRGPAARA